ncbi:MAG: DUF5985 family protein [Bdellovibrionota bacterium]
METIVYVLCAMTSLGCAALLYRGYQARPSRLLFWAAICFGGFALGNVFLVVDLAVFPDSISLLPLRNGITLVSLGVLLYGLIWDVV